MKNKGLYFLVGTNEGSIAGQITDFPHVCAISRTGMWVYLSFSVVGRKITLADYREVCALCAFTCCEKACGSAISPSSRSAG